MRSIIKSVTAFLIALFAACAVGATSFDGEWNGNLQCGPALRNPAPAFSAPITMVVEGDAATLTRNTNEVTEILTGRIAGSGQASLSGSGNRKSSAGTWTTAIDGKFSGNQFSGNGAVYNKKGYKARECSVELAKVVTATPKASQQSETKPAPSTTQLPIAAAVAPTVAPATPSPRVSKPLPHTAKQPIVSAVAPTIAPAMPSAPMPTVAPPAIPTEQVEKNLTGSMKWGTADSCLEVQSEKKTMCYGFVTSGAVANVLRDACSQGGKCAVTGKFNDDKEEILSVSSAATLANTVVAPAEQKPATATPVASSQPEQPLVETVPARDFTVLKYALGAAGILALLGGMVLFVRRGQTSMRGNRQQSVEVKSGPPANRAPTQPVMQVPPTATPPLPPISTAPVVNDLTYQVVLNGVQPGKSDSEVRAKLAALFKATAAQVDSMLSAHAYILKKGAGIDVAINYRKAIEAAGGACYLVNEDEPLSFDIDLLNPAASQSAKAQIATGGGASRMVCCRSCGKEIHDSASKCPHCGVLQQPSSNQSSTSPKSQTVAALLCAFLGGIGAHRFYLRKTVSGVLYLLFFWTGIPSLIACVEIYVLAFIGPQKWAQKYNHGQITQPVNAIVKIIVLVFSVLVAITNVAILAAIALPSYDAYTSRTRTAAVTSTLNEGTVWLTEYQRSTNGAPLDTQALQELKEMSQKNPYIADIDAFSYQSYADIGARVKLGELEGSIYLVTNNAGQSWSCQAIGLPRRVLPRTCDVTTEIKRPAIR